MATTGLSSSVAGIEANPDPVSAKASVFSKGAFAAYLAAVCWRCLVSVLRRFAYLPNVLAYYIKSTKSGKPSNGLMVETE